jgi:hypothetical protein
VNYADAFMNLSACFHNGSANTSVDEERLVCSTFFTYVAHDIEEIKSCRDVFKSGLGMALADFSPSGSIYRIRCMFYIQEMKNIGIFGEVIEP